MNIFSRLRLRTKLSVLLGLSALAVIISIAVSASIMHDRMIDDRIDKVRAVVLSATGFAQSLQAEADAGHITGDQAKSIFRDAVHALRFGTKDDYILTQTYDGIVVVHGGDPTREGKPTASKDASGRSTAVLASDILRSANGGVMWYQALKPGRTEPQDKVSYVANFAPWREVFIAGAWIDDLDAAYRETLLKLSSIGGLILAVTLLVAWLVNHDITRSMGKLRGAMVQLANGELTVTVPGINREDEVGGMAQAVLVFKENAILIAQMTVEQKYLAEHDTLTGLANRVVLLTRLKHAIARAERYGNKGALLFIDLDRFKNVNDSLGHRAGDELLKQVSARLATRLRAVDTLSRHGGDEFLVLLEDIAYAKDSGDVAQSLISILTAPFILSGGHEVRVGASIGISVFPDEGNDADMLIQQADSALYEAKAAGKGTHRRFTSDLTSAATQRLEIESRMHRALAQHDFILHYQPLVSIATGRIKGVEALVRWQDGDKGLVPPGQFIPLAEETGFIVPLGEWVLRTACFQMKQWIDAGLEIETMAVNLSPQQFQQKNLQSLVSDILDETGLPAHCLELEITEGVLAGKAMEAEMKLRTLSDLGIHLAIDDFGTGYSSLSYLKRFPIDKLKIDQSFVRGIPSDKADMSIAKAVIALAKSLDLEVLAEGVETQAQWDFLVEHGCDTLQGYLFSRPIPAADAERKLIGNRAGAEPIS